MKSIAILCNYKLETNRVGGMDYFFWEFDTACKEAGHAITWYFPNTAHHGNYPYMHIIDAKQQSVENCFLNDVKSNSKKFDTIVTHFLEICTPFYKEVKEITKAKIIAVDHNPRPIEGYPLRKRLRKRINGLVYSKFIDLFIGVSDYTRRELIKDFGSIIASRVHVIYNGFDVSNIRIREKRALVHPTFLVACHLRASKGVQDLIRAVSIMPIEIKNEIKFDVYGDGPYRPELEKLVGTLKLNSNFTFKGSSNRLNEIYCLYDYLIHPTHMECFSLGILESLSANVPVITTPVGGNEEVIKDCINGFIFPVKDFQRLSKLLEEIYTGTKSIPKDISTDIRNQFTTVMMVSKHLNII
jgi:glycosyltransferase involved in cell wall biosynthesis